MSIRKKIFTLFCSAGLAGVARAQESEVPKEFWPPPGMCRIWLEKVPPRQQPAPTDCPTAVRNRPENGRVLFGDDYVEKSDKGEKKEIPFLKRFGDDRKKP